MFIRIGYDLTFRLPAPVPMVLLLHTHPSRAHTLVRPERLHTDPFVPVQEFTDAFGNRCARLMAPAGTLRLRNDAVARDSGAPEETPEGARQHPVEDLPPGTLQYLFSSRYCEVDLLSQMAWDLFGRTEPGWPRVQAICDWVQAHVEFGYQHARSTRTAAEVARERRGVCRDFQHLAIAFCRAMHIPARYATGYLGDIGIPPQPYPMDFSAWFEVFLGGRWYTLDARHNTPRIGRVLMAHGRDATDVALTTSFGAAPLESFLVWTDEVSAADVEGIEEVEGVEEPALAGRG